MCRGTVPRGCPSWPPPPLLPLPLLPRSPRSGCLPCRLCDAAGHQRGSGHHCSADQGAWPVGILFIDGAGRGLQVVPLNACRRSCSGQTYRQIEYACIPWARGRGHRAGDRLPARWLGHPAASTPHPTLPSPGAGAGRPAGGGGGPARPGAAQRRCAAAGAAWSCGPRRCAVVSAANWHRRRCCCCPSCLLALPLSSFYPAHPPLPAPHGALSSGPPHPPPPRRRRGAGRGGVQPGPLPVCALLPARGAQGRRLGRLALGALLRHAGGAVVAHAHDRALLGARAAGWVGHRGARSHERVGGKRPLIVRMQPASGQRTGSWMPLMPAQPPQHRCPFFACRSALLPTVRTTRPPPTHPTRAGGHAHRAYLPSMRQHLQQHLQLQEALVSGFAGFLGRNAEALVALVASPAGPSPGKGAGPQPQGMVSAAELDRLGLLLRWAGGGGHGVVLSGRQISGLPRSEWLQAGRQLPSCRHVLLPSTCPAHVQTRADACPHALPCCVLAPLLPCRPATPEEPEAGEGQAGPSSSTGGSGRRKRRLAAEGGSPMDVCATPFTGKPAGCTAAARCAALPLTPSVVLCGVWGAPAPVVGGAAASSPLPPAHRCPCCRRGGRAHQRAHSLLPAGQPHRVRAHRRRGGLAGRHAAPRG